MSKNSNATKAERFLSTGFNRRISTFTLKHAVIKVWSVASVLFTAATMLPAASTPAAPSYWKWAVTPPMGWNSYDAWGNNEAGQAETVKRDL